MNGNQKQDGQADRVRAGLQWLGSLVREIKFGSIRGVMVRDGVIGKGPKFRVTHTGKPGGRGSPGKMATVGVLEEALRDLARETTALAGDWKLKVKVVNGTILSWDVEESGTPATTVTK